MEARSQTPGGSGQRLNTGGARRVSSGGVAGILDGGETPRVGFGLKVVWGDWCSIGVWLVGRCLGSIGVCVGLACVGLPTRGCVSRRDTRWI